MSPRLARPPWLGGLQVVHEAAVPLARPEMLGSGRCSLQIEAWVSSSHEKVGGTQTCD